MELLNVSVRRVVLCTLAMIAAASPAVAQDLSPVNTFFTSLGTALTGPTGRAIGLVALAGVGLMFLTGRMNWGFALSIVLGLVILFGAGTILGGIGNA
jgi:type IV secretion system protein VirB2